MLAQEAIYAISELSIEDYLSQNSLKPIINVGASFESNCFTLKTCGTIWIFMSLSASSNTSFAIDLFINGVTTHFVSSLFSGCNWSLSAGRFGSIKKGDAICLKPNFTISSKLKVKLMFLAIHLDDTTMAPYTALAVNMRVCYYDYYNITIDSADMVIENEWNDTLDYSKVLIPLSGIYFVAITFQADSYSCNYLNKAWQQRMCEVSISVFLRSAEQPYEIHTARKYFLEGNFAAKVSYLSSSFMYQFEVGNELSFSFKSAGCQNFFAYNFVLYEPLHKTKVAWTLKEPTSKASGKICFSKASVNVGNAWDIHSCYINISISGLYFVALKSLVTSTVANNLTVFRNKKQSIIEVVTLEGNISSSPLFFDSHSQASLASFQPNDILHVETFLVVWETTFTGFLLYLS